MSKLAERDELVASHLLRFHAGEGLQVNEQVVTLAKNPLWLADRPKERDSTLLHVEQTETLATILRTGSIFVYARDDIPPPAQEHPTELPPMPFPRMWLEVHGTLPEETFFVDIDGRPSAWLGFGLVEVEPCLHWDVLMVYVDLENAKTLRDEGVHGMRALMFAKAIRDYPLKRNDNGYISAGFSADDLALMADDDQTTRRIASLSHFPETLVQLLHTLGVTHQPVPQPRPVRREFQRKFGIDHPQVYYVRLRSTTEAEAGKGDRQFHHRWLVRGHYRRHEFGTHVVRGKGRCTWVRPYIKGPEGAPWKGRPIYTTVRAEDAA